MAILSTALILFLGLIIAIMLSAFYSGSETAAISVNEADLRQQAADGQRGAKKALALLSDQRRLLAIVLVGTNVANVMAALLCERLFLLLGSSSGLPEVWFTVLNFIVITPLLLLLGEIVPKHYGRVKAGTVLPRLVALLQLSASLFLPIMQICTSAVLMLLKPFGIDSDKTPDRKRLSLDDLKAMVGHGGRAGHIERSEQLMIARIFDLSETIVREIMCPLVDVAAFHIDEASLPDIRETARETGFSRFPVYKERAFNMTGYLDVYDILRDGDGAEKKGLKGYVRPPFYVPETMTTGDLLKAFLRSRQPAAIVLDEHGGSVGWVTREDVLEEIVGEIEDEFDPMKPHDIHVLNATTFVAAASLDLDDLNRGFELHLPEDEDFDTLGGLVFTRLGRVPHKGDSLREGDTEYIVEEMDGVKISKVRIKLIRPPVELKKNDEDLYDRRMDRFQRVQQLLKLHANRGPSAAGPTVEGAVAAASSPSNPGILEPAKDK